MYIHESSLQVNEESNVKEKIVCYIKRKLKDNVSDLELVKSFLSIKAMKEICKGKKLRFGHNKNKKQNL